MIRPQAEIGSFLTYTFKPRTLPIHPSLGDTQPWTILLFGAAESSTLFLAVLLSEVFFPLFQSALHYGT